MIRKSLVLPLPSRVVSIALTYFRHKTKKYCYPLVGIFPRHNNYHLSPVTSPETVVNPNTILHLTNCPNTSRFSRSFCRIPRSQCDKSSPYPHRLLLFIKPTVLTLTTVKSRGEKRVVVLLCYY